MRRLRKRTISRNYEESKTFMRWWPSSSTRNSRHVTNERLYGGKLSCGDRCPRFNTLAATRATPRSMTSRGRRFLSSPITNSRGGPTESVLAFLRFRRNLYRIPTARPGIDAFRDKSLLPFPKTKRFLYSDL